MYGFVAFGSGLTDDWSAMKWLQGCEPADSLHAELKAFQRYVALTDKERLSRKELVMKVHGAMKNIWPGA